MVNFALFGFGIIICSTNLCLAHKTSTVVVLGLSERLEQFKWCNIRVTSDFESTDFEGFHVPVVIIDAKISGLQNMPFLLRYWSLSQFKLGVRFMAKYRKEICTVDFVINLGEDTHAKNKYIQLDLLKKQWSRESMDERYLVFIRMHRIALVADDHMLLQWGHEDGAYYLMDLNVFVWTVIRECRKTEIQLIQTLTFKDIIHICNNCGYHINSRRVSKMFTLEEQTTRMRLVRYSHK